MKYGIKDIKESLELEIKNVQDTIDENKQALNEYNELFGNIQIKNNNTELARMRIQSEIAKNEFILSDLCLKYKNLEIDLQNIDRANENALKAKEKIDGMDKDFNDSKIYNEYTKIYNESQKLIESTLAKYAL